MAIAASAAAQQIPGGVPLQVNLERRARLQSVGGLIHGRLAESVYLADRIALPAGSLVEGRIAEIGGVSKLRRFSAALSGSFTPPRQVRAQFDSITLPDGLRLSIATEAVAGTPYIARASSRPKTVLQRARAKLKQAVPEALLPPRGPGKLQQVRSRLLGMLPYQRQVWPAGTRFAAPLAKPVAVPAAPVDPAQLAAGQIRARLVAPVSSAGARKGDPIEAAVTAPVFSPGHLLIPEGSRLIGEIVEARPARWLHRNGKLHFIFRQIRLPDGGERAIQGYLEEVDADFGSHLALDSEGAAAVRSPKTRFLFPAIAAAAAGLSFHQDYNAQGIPDRDIAGRAESGAVGLGLVGAILAQTSKPLASGIGIAGAAFSIYTTFIARGAEVALPAHTPVSVSLGVREAAPATPRR